MQNIYGLLIDTVSIQKYIYSSNKLKENIGASFIVEDIYIGLMKKSLIEVFGRDYPLDAWYSDKNYSFQMQNNASLEFEVGYIGGGNALLFFKEEAKLKHFTRDWTRNLLVGYPGINTAMACKEYSIENDDFKKYLDAMFEMLRKNKNENLLNTVVNKMNISADCKLSDYAAEVVYHDSEGSSFISKLSKVKLEKADDSKMKIKEMCLLKESKWEFTNKINELWQKEGENYVALVHIDGNNMGTKFQECKSLKDIRKLSHDIYTITQNSFKKLINYVIEKSDMLINTNHFDDEKTRMNKDNKIPLPIRSIVIGGDDITFICNAKLGMHLAEKFIDSWISDDESYPDLSACAGIAIIKSKYPFYRAYHLCENLCSEAKKHARKNSELIPNSNWLNYYILQNATSKDIEEFKTSHFGPYLLDDKNEDCQIKKFKMGMNQFRKWPKSKMMLLKNFLQERSDVEEKLEELKIQGWELPKIEYKTNYTQKGWRNNKTPYLDMIEFIDFYPQELIDNTEEEK